MVRKPKSSSQPNSDEALYKKWTTIVSTIVAVISLLSNAVLGIATYRLNHAKNDAEKQLNELRLEKEKLDGLIKRRDINVDLETRYYVVTGLAIMEIEAADIGNPESRPAIVQNHVLQQLQQWKERWEVGESIVVNNNGTQRSHGIVLLRISNRGKEAAHKVELSIREKDFSAQGEDAEDLWELQTDGWREGTMKLADLQAGQSVTVPLAHTLGTNKYFGRVLLPTKVEWFNPTLQKKESQEVAGMVPEEQWISKGTNISVGQ